MEDLKREDILILLEEAAKKAEELKLPSCSIAVVDGGGNLAGFLRPVDGKFSTVSLAINKAWTAMGMKIPSGYLKSIVEPGTMAYGIHITEPKICALGGGFPITRDGVNYLGGVAVSGSGSVEMDIAVCIAALEAAGFKSDFGESRYAQK